MRLRKRLNKLSSNKMMKLAWSNWETRQVYNWLSSNEQTYNFVLDLCTNKTYGVENIENLFKSHLGLKEVQSALIEIGQENLNIINFQEIADAFAEDLGEQIEVQWIKDLVEEATESVSNKYNRFKHLPDLIMDAVKSGNKEVVERLKKEYNELLDFFE